MAGTSVRSCKHLKEDAGFINHVFSCHHRCKQSGVMYEDIKPLLSGSVTYTVAPFLTLKTANLVTIIFTTDDFPTLQIFV